MKITTLGRGNNGGTFAQLWTPAGHEVTTLGRDDGDVSVNARRSLPNGSAPDATVPPGLVDEVALSAVVARGFGMTWQKELPNGVHAVCWEVEITVDLRFEQA
jgi:hypothetical protein